MKTTRLMASLAGILLSVLTACTFVSTKVHEAKPVSQSLIVTSPAKVHLYDGSMILYARGFEVAGEEITGDGRRFDLTRAHETPATTISIDSIAFVEYYKRSMESGPFLGGLMAPGLFVAAIQNEDIEKAFFGSCPTIYTQEDTAQVLQAECFSYSIAPDLETDDLDRLNIEDDSGRLRLTVRNEALETHYINQMSILAAEHPAGFEAFPKNRQFTESKQAIVLFGKPVELLSASNRTGGDLTQWLASRDSLWYQSDTTMIAELTERVFKDWVEIEAPVGDADSLIVALKFRNTLFHTVEFYDLVLNRQDALAVDWIGQSLANPFYRAELQRWYQTYFGIQVEIWNGQTFEPVQFIDDTGPIAWREVGFKIPMPPTPGVRLRLEFLPDHIMLDWVGVSFESSEDYALQEVGCQSIVDLNRSATPSLELINRRDDQYLVTRPPDAYELSFNVREAIGERTCTYFLYSTGYYIEWVRQSWLQSDGQATPPQTFQLSEASIREAAKRWRSQKGLFEKQFFDSRISMEAGK